MKKRLVAMLMTGLMVAVCVTGCGNNVEETTGTATEQSNQVDVETEGTEGENNDQAAADEVAALIDAIYVQERTDETDKQCADAKAAFQQYQRSLRLTA